ncbi:hypothetical protein BU24DRAFT_409538 [Aaosphaeria arxii CBS 175.79]|uniref:Uncharacterized protein n=1 Tax=Aaosphaeria arxii CBS 175.79 TaxID=1450172 RepID=A0A6A5XU39_9PLEO|nr:uncharacterized protein BU24DRAFT_409538 [Aaosphaeria arxii CBS 175.79]KAF2016436.1 hypothetical protein BU24DRAFT_409538 [Aaosphaeria arxii CBS 175.79]
MPPKRKFKATTKAAEAGAGITPTPTAKSAGAIRTSATKRISSSVQGLRTSRLQPTEPLHMTTRGAAKAASNHTSPAAPSSIAGSSRRSSLNDIDQFQDHSDVEDARPPKRSRVSTLSGSPPISMDSSVSQLPAVDMQTPVQEISEAQAMAAIPNPPKSSSKKRRASADSSQSSKTMSGRPNGVAARSESDVSDKQQRRKKRKTDDTPPDAADAPPELTDASTPPGSPEAIPEVSSSQGLQNVILPANGEPPAKAAKRLPGRRRQPHPDINVEVDLRRQLNIKVNYRSVAKIQKQILEEISKRTLKELEQDPERHKRSPAYEPVMAQLREKLDSRKHQIESLRQYKLEQLERVMTAEKHIQEEQYLNRFEEMRENLLLQCYYQMKQLQRSARKESGDGTDDEEHIINPTRVEFPLCNDDDRLGSKYASRSRAYVETERMLESEDLRKNLDRQRKAFLAAGEGFDDSIEAIPNGFAKFIGPDRADAIAHFNVASLANAAAELEKTPPPPEPPKVIRNEEADALFMLASLSTERDHLTIIKTEQDDKAGDPLTAPSKTSTPAQPNGTQGPHSPPAYPPTPPMASTPKKPTISPAPVPTSNKKATHSTPLYPETNGAVPEKPSEPVSKPAPVRSTHRIMDMLNNDDVPVHKSKEAQHSGQELNNLSTVRSTSIGQEGKATDLNPRDSISQHSGTSPIPPFRGLTDTVHTSIMSPPQNPREPMHIGNMMHASSADRAPTPTHHRDSAPPMRIGNMLDSRDSHEERTRYPRFSESTPRDRSDGLEPRHENDQHAQGQSLTLARAFSPHTTVESVAGNRRMSSGTYSASPATAPVALAQSPREHQTPYPHVPRHSPYDQPARPSWDDGSRRLSGSQGPPPSYAGSPPQTYPSLDYKQTGPTPPGHLSPYPPPPNTNNQSQGPAKSAAAPAPVNFRFAHYDPIPPPPPPAAAPSAPSRLYPHAPYSPRPHAPPLAGPSTPSHYPAPFGATPHSTASHNTTPQSTAPPGSTSHAAASPFPGYVPPAGSFQAPPPPPPPPPANSNQYPPLKIHQYGGQPILPASMAPPYSQPSPQGSPPAYGPAPQNNVSGYVHHSQSPYEAAPPPPQERAEPQPRPRRAYRSWHAPGTEFRPWEPNKPKRGSNNSNNNNSNSNHTSADSGDRQGSSGN